MLIIRDKDQMLPEPSTGLVKGKQGSPKDPGFRDGMWMLTEAGHSLLGIIPS